MKKLDRPLTTSEIEHLCTLPPIEVADADPHAWLKDSESWKGPSVGSVESDSTRPSVDNLNAALAEHMALRRDLALARCQRDGYMVRCNELIRRLKALIKRNRQATLGNPRVIEETAFASLTRHDASREVTR